jgi:hypothetical protein
MRLFAIAVAFMSAVTVSAAAFACPAFRPPGMHRVRTAEKKKPKATVAQPKPVTRDNSQAADKAATTSRR